MADLDWYADDDGRPLTEGEYRAWMERRIPQVADELSALLPEGLRFEWTPE